jgi:hypothetical protein
LVDKEDLEGMGEKTGKGVKIVYRTEIKRSRNSMNTDVDHLTITQGFTSLHRARIFKDISRIAIFSTDMKIVQSFNYFLVKTKALIRKNRIFITHPSFRISKKAKKSDRDGHRRSGLMSSTAEKYGLAFTGITNRELPFMEI